MNHMEKLLQKVTELNKKYELESNTHAHGFNIFEITNMHYKEVHICQVIKELIDPRGSHDQGDSYFRLFAKYVLGISEELNDDDYSKVIVTSEHVIDENRRIDIYIRIGQKFAIPIEAKIYAADQFNQCYDYYEYARRSGVDYVRLYYLTCDGHVPSKESSRDLTSDDIHLISFEKHIIDWLDACIKMPETASVPAVREILVQLINSMKHLTDRIQKDKTMEIKRMIHNRELFESAELIAETVEVLNDELEMSIFSRLDKEIYSKYGLKRMKDTYDFEKAGIKYKSNRGISYILGESGVKNYSVALRLALGVHIYAEICLFHRGEIYWNSIKDIMDANDVISGNYEKSHNSFAWMYLGAVEIERPNFEYHNEKYYRLIEEDAFETFINNVIADLDNLLDGLKPKYKPLKENVEK